MAGNDKIVRRDSNHVCKIDLIQAQKNLGTGSDKYFLVSKINFNYKT